jgi:hypothetical protein
VDVNRREAAWQVLNRTDDAKLVAYTFADMPLGQWAVDNLKAEYLGERWQRLPDWPTRLREWLQGAVSAALATEQFIRIVRPDALVLVNGIPVAERAVLTMAQTLGVRCVTWEDGPSPNTMIMRDHDLAVHYDFRPEWAQWRLAPLSAAESRRLDTLLQRRWFRSAKQDYVWSSARGDASGAEILSGLGLPQDRPVVVAFTNVLGDTSVFHSQRAFSGMLEWLQTVITYAQRRPEVSVIVRIHPAELDILAVRRFVEERSTGDRVLDILAESGITLPNNLRLIAPDDPTSSYGLLSLARLALVYVSSIGMEAAAMGIPVVSSGRAHYSDVGFTWQIEQREDLFPTIDRLIERPELPDEAIAKARHYLYLWFLRVGCELPFLETIRGFDKHPDGLTGMFQSFETLPDLAASAPPGLNRLIRFARGEAPFLAPPPSWRLGGAEPTGSVLAVVPDWLDPGACLDAIKPVFDADPAARLILLCDLAFAGDAEQILAACRRWAASRCEVAAPDDRPAAQGRVLTKARALVVAPDVEAGSLENTAALLNMPILRQGDPIWLAEALALVDPAVDRDLWTLVRTAPAV